MSLGLNQVQAFVVAAETLHFGRAAGRLHLTQQGVSRRITSLEQRLGVALFERRPGGVGLSHRGRRFLPHAKQVLAAAGMAATSVRSDSTAIPMQVDVWGPSRRPVHVVPDVAAQVAAFAAVDGRPIGVRFEVLRRARRSGRMNASGRTRRRHLASDGQTIERSPSIVVMPGPLLSQAWSLVRRGGTPNEKGLTMKALAHRRHGVLSTAARSHAGCAPTETMVGATP